MTATSVSIAGSLRVPAPKNEPARDFAPGSPESQSVSAQIDRVGAEIRELSHVINGERTFTGDVSDVVAPHDHAHVLGRLPRAGADVTESAIQAALDAQHDWSRTPWWE